MRQIEDLWLGGTLFRHKNAAIERLREILSQNEIGSALTGLDNEIARGCLGLCFDAPSRIGCGVDYIYIGKARKTDVCRARSRLFRFVRTDGSEGTFPFASAIKNYKKIANKGNKQACRI